MSNTPDSNEQILQTHAGLIHRVVMHCNNPGSIPDIEQILEQAEENDWKTLVSAIRQIISGERDESMLQGLDDEDKVIIESILRGIQDPATLPELQVDFDSDLAAPGIASLIHEASTGNTSAQQMIANLDHQMQQAGGDLGILAGRIRPLVEGERDIAKLAENMSDKGHKLVSSIIEELSKLEAG